MKKCLILSLTMVFLSTTMIVFASKPPRKIKWNGIAYIEEIKTFENVFSIKKCIDSAKEYYPEKSSQELNQMCCEAFINYLFEKSERCDCIVSEIYVDGECKAEWLNYKGEK